LGGEVGPASGRGESTRHRVDSTAYHTGHCTGSEEGRREEKEGKGKRERKEREEGGP
jgi:hypothetical protein